MIDNPELERLAFDIARNVAGDGAVEQVQVVNGVDALDRPAYHFALLVNEGRLQVRPGLLLTRLIQQLRDALDARGDEHFPVLRFLNRDDWGKRRVA
jgi:hypothetical protein